MMHALFRLIVKHGSQMVSKIIKNIFQYLTAYFLSVTRARLCYLFHFEQDYRTILSETAAGLR